MPMANKKNFCSRRNFFTQTAKNRRCSDTIGFKLMSDYLALAKVQPEVGAA
jgi:hypothetical protein